MSCETILRSLENGTDEVEVRAHVRTCDACLEIAIAADPDYLFRSLGVDEQDPPGGLDAFVEGVMQQVHLRGAERRLGRRSTRIPAAVRWSVAAALSLGVLLAGLANRASLGTPPGPAAPVARTAVLDRPIIERYDSPGAMIVELPAEETSDIRLVMVFDESLPADL
ncbi:MAG TPA: hypothetical protein VMS56_04485 [Thermoanaerobaculia bacterium]|nr:hypothetical protein [Thermoanaerobaculia bacterium]